MSAGLIPPCICLWDLHSFQIRDDQMHPLVSQIRYKVTHDIGRHAEKAFIVCCDVRAIPLSTTRTLNKIRNVDIVHVDRQTNWSAEEKIKQKLHQFDIDFRATVGTIILISGNNELCYFLSNMSRSGWSVTLFHPRYCSRELLDCVDHSYDVHDILQQATKETHVHEEKKEKNVKLQYALMSNLPLKDMGVNKVVHSLMAATEEVPSQLEYINSMTGEAILSFPVANDELSSTGIAVLSKSYRKHMSKQIKVIAVKDPNHELARMKFTVQQHESIDSLEKTRCRTMSFSSFGDTNEVSSGISSASTNQRPGSPIRVNHMPLSNVSLDHSQSFTPESLEIITQDAEQTKEGGSSTQTTTDGEPQVEDIETEQNHTENQPTDDNSLYSDAVEVNEHGSTLKPTDTNSILEALLIVKQAEDVNPDSDDDSTQIYIDGSFDPNSGRVREELLTSDWASVVKPKKVKPASTPTPNPVSTNNPVVSFTNSTSSVLKKEPPIEMCDPATVLIQKAVEVYSNSYRPAVNKQSMQCFHWDNQAHLSEHNAICKFYHPKERCRFYPCCMGGAEQCGYAHPFCGVYCECADKDTQKNHRPKNAREDNVQNFKRKPQTYPNGKFCPKPKNY